jgi:hypothetical protein
MVSNDFKKAVLHRNGLVWTFGATPPRADASPEKIVEHGQRLVTKLSDILYVTDAFLICDPKDVRFSFLPSLEYAAALRPLLRRKTDPTLVLYRPSFNSTLDEHARFLSDCGEDYTNFIIVGGSPDRHEYPGVAPTTLLNLIGEPYFLGAQSIPSRGVDVEVDKMMAKEDAGAQYHVTQIVFDQNEVLRPVLAYKRQCDEMQRDSQRAIVGVAPILSPANERFLEKRLRITIPDYLKRNIRGGSGNFVDKSIQYVVGMAQRIVELAGDKVPLGFHIECTDPENISASVELLERLHEKLAGYRP